MYIAEDLKNNKIIDSINNKGMSFLLRNAYYRVMLCCLRTLRSHKATMHLFAEGTTKSTLEMYGQLRESEDNIFYSPVSIMAALGMLQLGAKGNTEQQTEKVCLSFIWLTSLNLSLPVSVQVNDNEA